MTAYITILGTILMKKQLFLFLLNIEDFVITNIEQMIDAIGI